MIFAWGGTRHGGPDKPKSPSGSPRPRLTWWCDFDVSSALFAVAVAATVVATASAISMLGGQSGLEGVGRANRQTLQQPSSHRRWGLRQGVARRLRHLLGLGQRQF